MARSPAGVYTLPAGNPVSTGQVITSALWNETFGDIAAEITESLDRSGRAVMEEPFQLDDGTVSSPGLTFVSETNTGLYREASNDVRMVIAGVPKMHWTANGVVMPAGVSIAQSETDEDGVNVSGNGTGSGLVATGGTTSGPGVTATGGATDGDGVVALGTGTGSGITTTGGASNGVGAIAVGQGTGNAITATGGSTSGRGIEATGGGTGTGVRGFGGTTSGLGGSFTGGAPNGPGVNAAGTGNGAGLVATGGSNGSAIEATSGSASQSAVVCTGVSGGKGLRAASSSTGVDVAAFDGYLDMSGAANPNGATAFKNHLTPKNIVKAWARVTTNASTTPNVHAKFNVSTVIVATTTMTFTFAQALDAGEYAAVVTCNGSSAAAVAAVDTSSGSEVTVKITKLVAAGAVPAFANMQTTDTGTVINLIVTGTQT